MRTAKLFSLILILTFTACNKKKSISGNYKLEGVGTVDTASGQNNIISYAILSILSNGAEFNFGDDGKFTISNAEKKLEGTYILSEDGKRLTMSNETSTENYEVTKTDRGLSLKNERDGSVLTLKE